MSSLRFLSGWPWPLGLFVALALALLAWWLYRRETRELTSTLRWLLPLLRSTAIFLLLLTFLEPVVHHRFREGNPGKITFLIDGSESMSTLDDPRAASTTANTTARTRYDRATDLLLRNEQISLQKLADEFEIAIKRMDDSQLTTLWQSAGSDDSPLPDSNAAWKPESWSQTSPLGNALVQAQTTSRPTTEKQPEESSQASVIVLLSDGQSNAGESPLETAVTSGKGTIFTVGFGATRESLDLAVLAIDCPPRVFRSDTLRGELRLTDRIGKGQAFRATLQVGSEVVWQQKLTAQNLTDRRVEFAIPVAPLHEILLKQLPKNVTHAVAPMQLIANVSSDVQETNKQNNQLSVNTSVAAQRSRLLIVDGQSRWETRYLRNMFERDPAWEVNCLIATDENEFQFPKTRDELFQFDLVMLGDLPSSKLSRDQIVWLREFVEMNGGGLVLITGTKRAFTDSGYAELRKLYPVEWNSEISPTSVQQRLPKRAALTSEGRLLAALRIDPRGEEESQKLWSELPTLQFVDKVTPLPGSEVLAMAKCDVDNQPLLVTRRFGAGRVLFAASDETWRWRYKVADLVHQRLWNQLARWSMRTPMAVQGEFISLDSGAANHALGDNVALRAQLRDPSGRPAAGKSPVAILSAGGTPIARVPLVEDPNLPATYYANVASLPGGDYDFAVEVAGYGRDALDVHANFSVIAPPSVEMQRTACDETMLRELAERGGGAYVAEAEAEKLFAMLRPLSKGRFVESDTVLWQTYWWFTAAMLLLVAEWWLRKRAGLI